MLHLKKAIPKREKKGRKMKKINILKELTSIQDLDKLNLDRSDTINIYQDGILTDTYDMQYLDLIDLFNQVQEIVYYNDTTKVFELEVVKCKS